MVQITHLMPAAFREAHDRQVAQYYQRGYCQSINVARKSFGQDSFGFLFSCQLMYKVLPPLQIDKDMQFMAFL